LALPAEHVKTDGLPKDYLAETSPTRPPALQRPTSQTSRLLDLTVPCQESSVELTADRPELRLELTCDDEPLVYCAECWEREFALDRPFPKGSCEA
jgi:hypothetical protein